MTYHPFIQNADSSNISVVLFTDDTSVIINESTFVHLVSKLTVVFRLMNKWFQLNMLSLNFNRLAVCNLQLNKFY
jgi:hypothetical protein